MNKFKISVQNIGPVTIWVFCIHPVLNEKSRIVNREDLEYIIKNAEGMTFLSIDTMAEHIVRSIREIRKIRVRVRIGLGFEFSEETGECEI